jgi:type IV secretion system protein TrbL
MPANTGILTTLLNAFVGVFSAGPGLLAPTAARILFLISAIELTFAGLWWALKGENVLVGLLQKTLLIGLFAFFVLNWPTFLNAVLNGFIWVGFQAGGSNAAAGLQLIKNPSGIIDQAMLLTYAISQEISSFSLTSIGSIVMYGWAYIFTILAFFFLALQVFVTYLEFYIVAALTLVLVPFGVFKHTAFIAERALGTVISFGVKLMVLSFIIAAAGPVLSSITVAPVPTLTQAYSVLLAAMAIAYLAWHAPAIAGGMISGGPSLTAGSAAGFVAASTLGALGVAAAGSAAARSGASAALGATRVAASAAGTLRAGGALGVAGAEIAGESTLRQAAAGAGGAGLAVVRSLTTAASRPFTKAGRSIRESFEAGQVRAWRSTDRAAPAQAPAAPTRPGGSPTMGAKSAAQAVHSAKSTIPPESSPGPGMQAPIRTDE